MGYPLTSVRNVHHSLPNDPEQLSSQCIIFPQEKAADLHIMDRTHLHSR